MHNPEGWLLLQEPNSPLVYRLFLVIRAPYINRERSLTSILETPSRMYQYHIYHGTEDVYVDLKLLRIAAGTPQEV